jgi:hypothetical protein
MVLLASKVTRVPAKSNNWQPSWKRAVSKVATMYAVVSFRDLSQLLVEIVWSPRDLLQKVMFSVDRPNPIPRWNLEQQY